MSCIRNISVEYDGNNIIYNDEQILVRLCACLSASVAQRVRKLTQIVHTARGCQGRKANSI